MEVGCIGRIKSHHIRPRLFAMIHGSYILRSNEHLIIGSESLFRSTPTFVSCRHNVHHVHMLRIPCQFSKFRWNVSLSDPLNPRKHVDQCSMSAHLRFALTREARGQRFRRYHLPVPQSSGTVREGCTIRTWQHCRVCTGRSKALYISRVLGGGGSAHTATAARSLQGRIYSLISSQRRRGGEPLWSSIDLHFCAARPRHLRTRLVGTINFAFHQKVL